MVNVASSNDKDPDFVPLIRAVLDRALADFVEIYGRERAVIEWSELVAEHSAQSYHNALELDDDVLIADGAIELSGRYKDVLPPSNISGEVHILFWKITDATILRRLMERLGYTDPPANFMFDRFVTRSVTTGGNGLVIEAYDPKRERVVAIKLWLDAAPKAQAGLLAQAERLTHFSHPNVVTIHETGRWRNKVFFVMEWIECMDAHRWLKEPRAWPEVLTVFLDAGEGLAAAHAANIEHRNFKPGNMLIRTDGEVVVTDFAIADSSAADDDDDDDDDKNEKNDKNDKPIMVVGTRCYVAPERLRRERGDARSDQFSFCVALWEALHGRRPYVGQSRSDMLGSIERGAIDTGPQTKHVPHSLSRVVRKGLAAEPDQRYANMRDLLEALRGLPSESEAPTSDAGSLDASPAFGGLLNAPRLQELDDEPADAERPGGSRPAPRYGPSWLTFM